LLEASLRRAAHHPGSASWTLNSIGLLEGGAATQHLDHDKKRDNRADREKETHGTSLERVCRVRLSEAAEPHLQMQTAQFQ
jgi:hypothetical protein